MRRRELRISFNSPAILTFVGICAIATILHYFTNGVSTTWVFSTYRSSLSEPLTYVRFFTHVFGHGSLDHFISNVTYLLLLGPILEEKHGSGTIWLVIAVTAVVTGVINYIFFPGTVLCGASGVVFALILLISFTGRKDGTIPFTFILVALIFGGQQIYQALTVQDNISQMAHIAGGVVGAIFGCITSGIGRYRR